MNENSKHDRAIQAVADSTGISIMDRMVMGKALDAYDVEIHRDARATIRSLMLAENLGDVHDVINRLCVEAGVDRLEGDFLEGWTDEDFAKVEK